MFELLRRPISPALLLGVISVLIALCAASSIAYGVGFRYAAAIGEARLASLTSKHAEQARQAASDSRVQLLQQVTRANQAEALMLSQMDQHAKDKQQLQERIAYVTSHYLPTANAAPVVIPHCVFTAGWLRDYNAALGVPTAAASTVTSGAGQAASTAADANAELLESGVTPADILAHAQDYGQWARNLASQVMALLTAREGCTP
jgi:hypothetical protein